MALLTLGRISRILGGAAGAIGGSLIGLFMGFPLIAIALIGVLGLGMGVFLPLLFGGFGRGGGFFPGGFGVVVLAGAVIPAVLVVAVEYFGGGGASGDW